MHSYWDIEVRKSNEDQLELVNKYIETGDIKYKQELIESFIPFVLYKAREAQAFYHRLEFDDICQSMLMGLSDAIEWFDPDKGSILWYADKYMISAVQKFGSYNDPLWYKHNEVVKIQTYFNAIDKLQEKEKAVTNENISDITGYSEKTIVWLQSIIGNKSLDKDLSDWFNLYDIVEGSVIDKLSLNVSYIKEAMILYIWEENTDLVIDYHMYNTPFRELADKVWLSIEWVRKRINQSVDKLRKVFNT